MTSFRKLVPAFSGLLFAGIIIAGGSAPAWAAPPFPAGAGATALVGGAPPITVQCPVNPARSDGSSTAGIVSGGSPAGARCTSTAAAADGQYAITGATPPLPALRFGADCTNNGDTGGGVDVPIGTSVNGGPATTVPTNVTTLNTPVKYPDNTTAILNQVITTNTSVTRNAVVITSGAASGTVIGRVVCGTPIYTLAVEAPTGAGATPNLAPVSSSAGSAGSSRSGLLLLGGAALALLVLAQLTLGRSMMRRRRGDAAG